ncbi:hypothetical protein PR048_028447 [Dryococelus australis]|uniref:Uncharacterized protein n=1 Tax=Dryococelus australis TaxID=614101 RepID=A0ABQ9GD83_9NEOP|nr:hypothetical protein PR048_028447 [Dryococelus australis]
MDQVTVTCPMKMTLAKFINKQKYLYTPNDYVDIMKAFRKKNPLVVTRMKPEEFDISANLEKCAINRKK